MIQAIKAKFVFDQFEFSKHAVDQTILRNISVSELREAVAQGQIIEDYPNDKYGPSCLVFGMTQTLRPIHLQVSYPTRPILKVITAYEPDADIWIDFRVRRVK